MICHLLRKKLNSNFPTILKVSKNLNFFLGNISQALNTEQNLMSRWASLTGTWIPGTIFSFHFACLRAIPVFCQSGIPPQPNFIYNLVILPHGTLLQYPISNGGSARHKNALRLCQCIVPPIRGVIHALSSSTPHWYSVWVDWWDATHTSPRK